MAVCTGCGVELAPGVKFCSECGTPVTQEPSREQRKTVTAVFCDLAGSTKLGESTDPEALRALLARYFQQMKVIIERHGGSVEKFIGDAVMAVFGVPVLHEDDALRACRAALEMREALPGLGLSGRIGVNTGEVVSGTSERLATGDAVNVAARLEQAAGPGEVLIGESTRSLLRGVVETGDRRLLDLKGKSEQVPAYPLLATAGDAISARRLDAPIIGRAREQRVLNEAWERAQSEQACQLFTVLGAAGVGKSRLAAEFVTAVQKVPHADQTKVLYGRCLSYGEGITYTPVTEMLTQLDRRPSDPRAAQALASLMGESESGTVASADEIARGFRKLLEEIAPVVCVFDDLHWAEPTLVDLVDHVADWSRDAPILLLCLARPELLDRRTNWAGGKLNATTLLLEVLTPQETDELIDRLLGDGDLDHDLRDRIATAAQGNPLFVEEMLAMAAESGGRGQEIVVPPTIQALLSARIDQLDQSERTVLERGAVEGQVFHLGGLTALTPGEADVPGRLMRLVRKELVRPERSEVPGDDAFRFRHLLIRDAAYDGLPKAIRAELHARFADWLETSADLAELDEVAGYHLEQAHRYRLELGLDDRLSQELGFRASVRLAAAGDRAAERHDIPAAVSLLTRALDLASQDPLDATHELRLLVALWESGALRVMIARAGEVTERAVRLGDERLATLARLWEQWGSIHADAMSWTGLEADARAAIELFEQSDDAEALAHAWMFIATTNVGPLRWNTVLAAAERSGEYARRCGDTAFARQMSFWASHAMAMGPTPAAEVLAWFEQHPERLARAPSVDTALALLEAMTGDFAGARARYARAYQGQLEIGERLHAAAGTMWLVETEMLAGDNEAAARAGVAACRELEELQELSYMSTVAGLTSEAFYRLGDYDQARHYIDLAERSGNADDLITQVLVMRVRAKLHVIAGELTPAEGLAREALTQIQPVEMINEIAETYVDLAEVLFAAGKPEEALDALDTAAEIFTQKGNVARAASVAELRATRTGQRPAPAP